jgi:hypothetical protein
LPAPGISMIRKPTGGAMSALWGTAVKKAGGVLVTK